MENIVFVFAILFFNGVDFTSSSRPDPSVNLKTLVNDYGYAFEVHHVTTEDGYILELHRIPGVINKTLSETKKGKVALLAHGLIGSSASYLTTGPKRSLACILVDKGYDVWLLNNRGSTFSRKHVSKLETSYGFWDFSWHEMGKYDLPSAIDYVLHHTNQSNLNMGCFSQGCTEACVMGSLKPEYNEKVKFVLALAPAVFWTYVRGLMRFLIPFTKILAANLEHFMKYDPAGSSFKQVLHYAFGAYYPGTFRQYDYGPVKNLQLYNSITPPEYPLEKVNIPFAIYHGHTDMLVDTKDIDLLKGRLPNIVDAYLVPGEVNHYDFIFGRNIHQICYKRGVELMEKYNQE